MSSAASVLSASVFFGSTRLNNISAVFVLSAAMVSGSTRLNKLLNVVLFLSNAIIAAQNQTHLAVRLQG